MQMDKLKSLQKFTWDEVKVHNNPEDCWIVVEREVDGVKKGLILDVTEWAPNHPGGSIIYDGAGGVCTIMFWSYKQDGGWGSCGLQMYI
jgi:cytochrome b involved in lipid metabolism